MSMQKPEGAITSSALSRNSVGIGRVQPLRRARLAWPQ